MAIFNQILQALTGGARNDDHMQPAPGEPEPPLQGTGASLALVLQQLLTADPSQGIAGLLQKFEAAGLGSVIKSWIGSGNNQPITPDQLHSALGGVHIRELSQTANMSQAQLLSTLSQALPGVVDAMTPGGRILPRDVLSNIMAQLTSAQQQPPPRV